MEKMSHKTGKLLAAAVAATGLAGYGASDADAALILELRATGGSGGVVVSNDLGDGKHVAAPGAGSVVSFQLYGRVSGTDGLNNESLAIAGASVASSVGGLLGNLTHTISNPTFNGNSSQNGTVQDFDSDGDLDVGSLGTGTTGKIVYRSNVITPLNLANNATFIDANTAEVLLGTLTFTLTGSSGSAVVQIIPRGGTSSGVAQWAEDGIATNKTPGTGTFGANPPGVLIEVPEPASLGVLGIAGLGLLARRRNRA